MGRPVLEGPRTGPTGPLRSRLVKDPAVEIVALSPEAASFRHDLPDGLVARDDLEPGDGAEARARVADRRRRGLTR